MTNDNVWETVKQRLAVGTLVRCRVKEHHPFGILTTLADCPFDGLIQITDFKDVGRMMRTEYPPLGSEIEAVVLGFKERGTQIWLGVKPSQLSKAGDTP
jgi:ribosomal protein S1